MRDQIAIWYRAARPRSLTATYIPLALGAVLALDARAFNLFRFALALLGALMLQIGANLVNEYYDYRRGSDSHKVAGMGMVIKQNVLTPRLVLNGAIVSIALGVLIGLFLVTQTGPLLLWIGIGGVLTVVLYTAGPLPLAYIGLGEIVVFIFMGPLMVLGTYYVLAREVSSLPVWAALPIAFLVAAILHANNLRDMEADRASNKRTLAVLFGLRFARAEYVFLVGGAYAVTVGLVAWGVVPWTALIAFVTWPEAYRLMRIETATEDTALLHRAHARTARLHFDFGLWFVLGWLAHVLAGAFTAGGCGT